MFGTIRESRESAGADNGREWGEIAERVKAILEKAGRKAERIEYWQEAAEAGDLSAGAGDRIPPYDEDDWNTQREHLASAGIDSSVVLGQPVFQFYQAAAAHRIYVLRDLLPSHGLVGN